MEHFWETADAMCFSCDEKRQVYLQDDGFMLRKPWDDSRIPPEKRHLLYENYHPLFICRQRMSKQADAIMGMMPQGSRPSLLTVCPMPWASLPYTMPATVSTASCWKNAA